MTELDLLRTQAERVRASGILGTSGLTQKLFDFLIDCSIKGRAPKEIEIAMDAFGRGTGFDVSQDAVVRVYVYKLRRKLDEFYGGPGKQESHRIAIPRGEYRLTVAPQSAPLLDEQPLAPVAVPFNRWITGGLVASVLANVLFLVVGLFDIGKPVDPLDQIRNSSVWAPLLDDDLPIYLVVGDYYIFGEVDEFLSVKRLIRDFSINSPTDFERSLQRDPQVSSHYQDLNLAYLPTATAHALRDVMPILAPANARIRIIMASDIDANMLKSGHVVYVGFISGMGSLREIVFAGSRFAPGVSYDELHDLTTGTEFISDVGGPVRGKLKYRDYGYLSTFPGPAGNQFVIIAGTRDMAVMRTAELATRSAALEQFQQSDPANAFEALYEVYGFDRTDIAATLISLSPLNVDEIWRETKHSASFTHTEQQHPSK